MEKHTVPVEMTMEELEQYEKLAEKNGQPSVQSLILFLLEIAQGEWQAEADAYDAENPEA